MRKIALLAALAAITATAAIPAAGAARPRTKKVTVGDNYFGPSSARIKRGTIVKWVWPGDNGNTHNVKLTGAPRHVRKFTSPSAAAGFSYSRRFSTTGRYKFICVYHAGMVLRLTVVR